MNVVARSYGETEVEVRIMQHRSSSASVAERAASRGAAGRASPSLPRQVWHFVRHYLEMCIAMCVGGTALNVLAFRAGPSLLGIEDLRDSAPAVALVVSAILYTVPMTIWMRLRHMAWRPTLEMSAAPVLVAAAVSALYAFGVLSRVTLDAWLAAACFPWCVVMVGPMLLRLPLYTGRNAHDAPRAAGT